VVRINDKRTIRRGDRWDLIQALYGKALEVLANHTRREATKTVNQPSFRLGNTHQDGSSAILIFGDRKLTGLYILV
jgi:hypothetical protein